MKERGFTLVELSIVLIIIGLLVAGILVAQSMIRTTQINSLIRQLQQYDVAVSNFQLSYGCIPGDCRAMTPASNSDGLIESGATQDDNFTGEIAAFWNVLSMLGLVKDNIVYSTDATTGIRAGVNVPRVSLGRDTGVMVSCEWESAARAPGDEQDYPDWDGRYNYYHLFSTAGTTSDSILTATPGMDYSLPAIDALAVDTKMDNGNAITGNVRVAAAQERKAFYSGAPTYNETAGSGCVMNGDNTQYNIASTSAYPCALMIPLLSQVGQRDI